MFLDFCLWSALTLCSGSSSAWHRCESARSAAVSRSRTRVSFGGSCGTIVELARRTIITTVPFGALRSSLSPRTLANCTLRPRPVASQSRLCNRPVHIVSRSPLAECHLHLPLCFIAAHFAHGFDWCPRVSVCIATLGVHSFTAVIRPASIVNPRVSVCSACVYSLRVFDVCAVSLIM